MWERSFRVIMLLGCLFERDFGGSDHRGKGGMALSGSDHDIGKLSRSENS